jgi:hypothetical protein
MKSRLSCPSWNNTHRADEAEHSRDDETRPLVQAFAQSVAGGMNGVQAPPATAGTQFPQS